MKPRLFLNGATVMTTATDRVLEVARSAGFEGIEARAERLLERPDEARATKTSARPHQVWSLNGVRLSLHPDGSLDRQTLEADLRPRLQICEELGADYLL